MKEDRPAAKLQQLCDVFGKTRQAWYKSTTYYETKQMEGLAVIQKVKELRKSLPRCGGKKLYYLLADFLECHKIKLGRDALFDLLSAHNLLIKRKKSCRTTYSFHRFRKYPNLAKAIMVTRVNQLWVGDITYISFNGEFLYLSLLMDVFSRKIVGWSIQESLSAKGPLEALDMAINQRGKPKDLTHHSDRGVQYCCTDYIKRLHKNGIKISMTENGDPYENALAERVNRTIKEEFLAYYFFFTYQEAKNAVKRAVELYNDSRPHLSLNYKTPNEVYEMAEI